MLCFFIIYLFFNFSHYKFISQRYIHYIPAVNLLAVNESLRYYQEKKDYIKCIILYYSIYQSIIVLI